MRRPLTWWLAGAAAAMGCARPAPRGRASAPEKTTEQASFEAGGRRLRLEAVADDVIHFELAPAGESGRIPTTPMVAGRGARLPLAVRGRTVATAAVTAQVDDELCLSLRRPGARPTRICPSLSGSGGSLALWNARGTLAYGLGESCVEPGLSGGDWSGRVRRPGGRYGNAMVEFDGGHCGDAQFPILYAVDPDGAGWALFLDDARALTWDLRQSPWRVTSPSPAVRGYLLAAPSIAEQRADYLALTGRPPVPPRAAFGLWVSEYGYEDWDEATEVVRGLRAAKIPVDGVVLDLQWFGGIREGADDTRMGTLTFDPTHFPDPAGAIARLRQQGGAGVIAIEESYVGRALPEHRRLAERGYLVRGPAGQPAYLDEDPWWGKGGMIDWTDPAAGDFWHDWKRKPLVDLGIVGHWTDLGEPEQYDPRGIYHGFAGIGRDHASVHNLYNLAWASSIARGYRRHREPRRPFILTRSGTSGIQRTGAAMWSGDVAARYTTLAAQQRSRLHVSLSGIDYYGSDVGGFKRAALRAGLSPGELYTTWLVDAALTEVPIRPHTFNLEEAFETSPARIGEIASNRAAIRLRYRLIPYLYSLAHRAHRRGAAVFPPLVARYPADPVARTLGDHVLVGDDLLAVTLLEPGLEQVRVYLPRGVWFDFYDHRRRESAGSWIEGVPVRRGGLLRPPLFAREGAIIPLAKVDGETWNTWRPAAPELRVRVYPSESGSAFTLVEDDGETVAYLRGEVRETRFSQRRRGRHIDLEVGAPRGRYRGPSPAIVLEVILDPGDAVKAVTIDGRALEAGPKGWAQSGPVTQVRLPTPAGARRRIGVELR